ncbi:MAG: hypothetical protein U5J99_12535 [Parvularculaceae bacterium]|nr:hypothetical protein [Parvularculaceae bacterium]
MIARQNDIDPEKVFEQIYSFSEKLSASEKNGAERDEFVREVGNEFDRRGISLRHRTTVGNAINQMVYPKDDTLKGVLILLAHSLNQLTDQSRRPFDADLLLNAFHAFNSDWDFKKWKRGPTLETSAPRKKINRTIEVLEGLSIRLRYGATAHREARAEPMMARVGGDGRLFTLTAVTGEPGMTRARVFEGIGFLRGGVALIEEGF